MMDGIRKGDGLLNFEDGELDDWDQIQRDRLDGLLGDSHGFPWQVEEPLSFHLSTPTSSGMSTPFMLPSFNLPGIDFTSLLPPNSAAIQQGTGLATNGSGIVPVSTPAGIHPLTHGLPQHPHGHSLPFGVTIPSSTMSTHVNTVGAASLRFFCMIMSG
jgi:hypothetical protein